jgi:hypothetical protein
MNVHNKHPILQCQNRRFERWLFPVQDYDDLMSKLAYFNDNLEELYNKKTKGYSSLPIKI